MYFKVGCLEEIGSARVVLVVCVNIILVAIVAVQKLIEGSNGVRMTRKFTGCWNDASCISRNFYR